MGSPTLYYLPQSGPCRTVMMAAKVLGINLNYATVDLFNKEHLTPEFLKMNPMHTVPTLKDGDFSLAESRSIITYLADKYGKNDSIYPKDVKKRAAVNQKLFFDLSLYTPILDCYVGVYMGNKSFDESRKPLIDRQFTLLNTFLEKNKYVSGDTLTLADIAIVSTVGTAVAVLDFNLNPYPNVVRWFSEMKKQLPDYKQIMEENEKKLRELVYSFKNK